MTTHRNDAAWIAIGVALSLALTLIFYSNRRFYEEFLITSASYGTSALPRRPENNKMRVEIDFGENRRRIFEGVSNESSKFDRALKSIASTGRIAFTAGNEKIFSIAGARGSWKIYKNGALTKNPLSSLIIGPGDRYILRLEK